jgi:uncharacterized protein YlxW (UPF0749 family)
MAGSVAFDTLKFVEKLEASDFPHAQAKATAEAFAEATAQELATKSDLLAVKSELKADLAATRSDLQAELAALRSDLQTEIASVRSKMRTEFTAVQSEIELSKRDLKIWFSSVMVVAVGVILAAIRYLPAGRP